MENKLFEVCFAERRASLSAKGCGGDVVVGTQP